jgi:hypothetical protein
VNIFIVILFTIAYSAVNAGMDYINFACGTGDAWHLLKYFDRFFLIAASFSLAKIPKYEWKTSPVWFWVLFSISWLILIKIAVWDTVYYGCREQLIWLHNNLHLATGIEWLDRFLGFHI